GIVVGSAEARRIGVSSLATRPARARRLRSGRATRLAKRRGAPTLAPGPRGRRDDEWVRRRELDVDRCPPVASADAEPTSGHAREGSPARSAGAVGDAPARGIVG